jgi:thioredoxin-related protein
MQRLITPCFVVLLFLTGARIESAPARAEDPFSEISVAEARTLAEKEARPILIAFYEEACEPCNALDRELFAVERVRDWLGEKVVAIRTKDAPELVARYAIGPRPTILLISHDGAELERLDAPLSPDEFLDAMRAACTARESAVCLAEARERVDLGRRLVREGKSAQALEHFLWAFDHTRDEPTWAVARLTGLLGEIAALLPAIPEARTALEVRRNAAARVVLEDGRHPVPKDELLLRAGELGALNRWLDEPESTRRAWKAVRGREDAPPELAAVLFDDTLQVHLLSLGLFDELLAGIGQDPFEAIYQRLARVQELRQRAETDRRFLSRALAERNTVLNLTARCHQAMLAKGEDDGARDVAELLLVLEPRAQSYLLLIRSAERADRPALAGDLRDRGLASLEAHERNTLDSMLSRQDHHH